MCVMFCVKFLRLRFALFLNKFDINTCICFYAPHSVRAGHLDLLLYIRLSVLKIINFVTKVEKCGHLCPIDTFLVFFLAHDFIFFFKFWM